jgi:anti-sigma-K factor RskA
MNIKEFIETSGMLEEYVLGHLPEKEAAGIECLAQTYPEIKQEIEVLNQSLGKYMAVYEKTPPAFLKEKIFSQMTFADDEEEFLPEAIEEVERATKVIPLWSKMALAASVLLAAITAWQFNENSELKTSSVELSQRVEALEGSNLNSSSLLAEFSNPANKIVKLAGTEGKPDAAVTVMWNQEDNSVELMVNNLPSPEAGKQYQLWIIGENGPEDMGMLDNDFKGRLLSMKSVNGKPSAFAITLEKEGGVPSPTLEQLYVIGNV